MRSWLVPLIAFGLMLALALSNGDWVTPAFEAAGLALGFWGSKFLVALNANQLRFVFPVSALVLLAVVLSLGSEPSDTAASVGSIVFGAALGAFVHLNALSDRARREHLEVEGQAK